MNPQLDKLIADIDAVINGEDPGAVGSGDLAPEVKEKMRALLKLVVVDCRLCEHRFPYDGEGGWCGASPCVAGDKFRRQEVAPLWEMQP